MICFSDWQARFERLHCNKVFKLFVIAVILISALAIGASTYDMPPRLLRALNWLDIGITLFFLLEIAVRMLAAGSLRRFFSQGWNVFDFVIVVGSLIPIEERQMLLLGRLLRIFWVLRLVSIIPELRLMLNAFLGAIPRLGYVSLLMFILFYIYGAAGSLLFHDIDATLWGDISISMLTLFRVATFDDWSDVTYALIKVYPISWIFILSFIFLIAFVFLNMMIGIVLEALQREQKTTAVNPLQTEEERGIEVREANLDKRLERIERVLVYLVAHRQSPRASTERSTESTGGNAQ